MKITVQEKMAELESRVAELERQVGVSANPQKVTVTRTITNSTVGKNGPWTRMWAAFDELFS